MRIARWFIYGFPVLLLLLIGISFWNSTRLASDKKNEMTLGVLGEPSTLNPIQQADSASSQVTASIFNGLLKYNPDLEIIGDLATSWSLSQTTTFVFRDPAAAQTAAALLDTRKADWVAWTLTRIESDENRLLLFLNEPGLDTSRHIASLLPADSFAPLATLRVEPKENARDILPSKILKRPLQAIQNGLLPDAVGIDRQR
jgi:hypothetical protein